VPIAILDFATLLHHISAYFCLRFYRQNMMENEQKLYRKALLLSLFTIFYNIVEGIVSLFFGYRDETLALFGFGLDSFIEVLSGVGIVTMILRIRKNQTMEKSKFEHAALKITGTAFYLLSLGLVVGSVMNIITRHKPETTRWGIIISVLSILIMYWLMRSKQKVGRELDSEPIMADANCTKICIYMSVVLLLSSLIYEVTGFAYADVIGSIGLIYFSVSEGKEAFEKSQGKECSCDS
jgi:divalent metal cation (Fe/Co/Zn/Cd) transporter